MLRDIEPTYHRGSIGKAFGRAILLATSSPSSKSRPRIMVPNVHLQSSVKAQGILDEGEMSAGIPDLQFHVKEPCRYPPCEIRWREQIIHTGDHQTRHADFGQIAVHTGCQTCSP